VTDLGKNKLIIALDVDTAQRARELFSSLRDFAAMFKIGMQLFTAVGPAIVREIINAGGRVFLDLKYHDIPNTVAAAGVEAARLGVSIFNVHTSGGTAMMRDTADAVATVSRCECLERPKIIDGNWRREQSRAAGGRSRAASCRQRPGWRGRLAT